MQVYPTEQFISDELKSTLTHMDRQHVRRGVNVLNETVNRSYTKPRVQQVLCDWVNDLTNTDESSTVTPENILYWIIAIGYSNPVRLMSAIEGFLATFTEDEADDTSEVAMRLYDVLEADYNRALMDRAQTYQRLASFQLYDIRSNLELITRAIKHNIELQLTLAEDESVNVTIESVVPAQVRIELDGIATLSRTYFVGTHTIEQIADNFVSELYQVLYDRNFEN